VKIVICEIEPWERAAFEGLQNDHDVIFENAKLSAETASKHADADIISTFIYSNLDRDILKAFPNLKLIATRSTGFDHIHLETCAEQDIRVANVPTYGENTVAEHVFALLLAIAHNLIEAVDRTRRGNFSMAGLRGFDLQGKTMGIIGTGHIGRHVARIAKGFAMDVVAFDIAPDEAAADEIGYRYIGFKDVLKTADVVSLHVPATKATHHMIAAEEFDCMKDGSILINTARGSVVHVRSLVGALSTGKVAAAGLDVLPEEPVIREEAELLRSAFNREHDMESLLADHILLRLRNVVITPHSAFDTHEAVNRILHTTRSNIEAFIAAEPQNLVA
jgi:D-lactate dehydrogenase